MAVDSPAPERLAYGASMNRLLEIGPRVHDYYAVGRRGARWWAVGWNGFWPSEENL